MILPLLRRTKPAATGAAAPGGGRKFNRFGEGLDAHPSLQPRDFQLDNGYKPDCNVADYLARELGRQAKDVQNEIDIVVQKEGPLEHSHMSNSSLSRSAQFPSVGRFWLRGNYCIHSGISMCVSPCESSDARRDRRRIQGSQVVHFPPRSATQPASWLQGQRLSSHHGQMATRARSWRRLLARLLFSLQGDVMPLISSQLPCIETRGRTGLPWERTRRDSVLHSIHQWSSLIPTM